MHKPIDALRPHSLNAQMYGEEEVAAEFVESIRGQGVLEPLAVKQDGTIISGHRRWRAARAAGMATVPVQIVSYADDLAEREALIGFNRQREKTFSQKMAEAEQLQAIERERARERQATSTGGVEPQLVETFPQADKGKTRDKVAAATGIGSGRTYDKAAQVWEAAKAGDETAQKAVQALDEGKTTIHKAYKTVEKLQAKVVQERAAQAVEAAAKEPGRRQVVVERGQWWKLGKHRLYCGDTSEPEFWQQIPSAAFAFADPPYNAEAAEWDSGFVWEHDWLAKKADVVAVTPGIEGLFAFAKRTSMPYKWSAACWITNGMTRGAMGFGNWIYVALFADGSVHRQAQDFAKVTISNAETPDTAHKGRKPPRLLAWLIETFSERGACIIDPFLGSGTTLLVAEEMERVCYGGEIAPEFCAELIARWEQQTARRVEVLPHGTHPT